MSGSDVGRLILSKYKTACINLGIETQRKSAWLAVIPVEKKEWDFSQRKAVETLEEEYDFARGKVQALEELIEVTVRS